MPGMDEAELRRQLEEHHEASYGWALSCSGRQPAEAKDVLQTAYLKILDGRARYDGRAAFKTWLFAVIRNTAADERRRHWLRTLGLARYVGGREPDAVADRPAEGLEREERQAAFRKALAHLPRRQQEVLHLVFYQEMSLQEAAVAMGVSVGSARTHYERAKARLRQRLRLSEDIK